MCEWYAADYYDTPVQVFDEYREAQAFMAQLVRLDISYIARIFAYSPKAGVPPFTEVIILEVANGGLRH
jgi:hypothetical protein|tara:strand:+ start:3437 stop:3643 length:207 start_codon:yes stop_codon:yes gene_type:complete